MRCEADIIILQRSDVCLTPLVWDKTKGKWVCPKADRHA